MSNPDAIVEVPLHRVAHGRAGDKGNRLNVSVMPYDPAAWPLLAEQLTERAVLALYAHRGAKACGGSTCRCCRPSISSSRTCWKAA